MLPDSRAGKKVGFCKAGKGISTTGEAKVICAGIVGNPHQSALDHGNLSPGKFGIRGGWNVGRLCAINHNGSVTREIWRYQGGSVTGEKNYDVGISNVSQAPGINSIG